MKNEIFHTLGSRKPIKSGKMQLAGASVRTMNQGHIRLLNVDTSVATSIVDSNCSEP